jgi:hypothetical protein
MKRVILILALFLSIAQISNAQARGKAIGLRFGNGGEISFQSALSRTNRLELDLGMNHWSNSYYHSGLEFSGVYQWVWGLKSIAPGMNWYLGLGATALSYYSTGFDVGLAGQIGIEYNFKIPLQLSLDYRPAFFFVDDYGYYDGARLALRYRF